MKPVTFTFLPTEIVGRDSVVRIRIRYGMDGQGIEYRLKRGFPQPSRPALGSTQTLQDGYQLPFSGVELSGCGVNDPPPSRSEVKERVKMYIY